MQFDAHITISPVIGGFVVSYPKHTDDGDAIMVQEVTTSVGRAMRIAKDAVNAFSLVKKTTDDAEA
jgi:hypothetical protein